jgi:hypothetical protein
MKEKKYIVSHYPHLIVEWDTKKNEGIDLNKITASSHKKVWWKCQYGHSWETTSRNRSKGDRCPYCSNRKVGYGNDLKTNNPLLAKEWHPDKNKPLKSSEVTKFSNKKVWWKCSKEHSWEAQISNRSMGKGCPRCYSNTSFPEQVIYYYVKKYFPDTINRKFFQIQKKKTEIDVYIPALKLGIEYDGAYYHKNREQKDREKIDRMAKEENIKVIRFREKGLSNKLFSKEEVFVIDNDLDNHLHTLLKKVGVENPDIDINRDKTEITELYKFNDQEDNFKELKPEAAKEWDYEQNGNLRPEMFKPFSSKKVFWICKKGHKWEARISNRSIGCGCPFCTGIVASNEHNVKTKTPQLLKIWDYVNNKDTSPEKTLPGSDKNVHWKCFNCSYEWMNGPYEQQKRKKCQNCKIPYQ